MRLNACIIGLMLSLTIAMPAHAEMTTEQQAEATLFFNQILQQTKNPVIAHLAQESLSKIESQRADAAYGNRQVEIPLLSQMNNSLAVPVMINDSIAGTFLVDTGATYTVITPRLAQKLGVQITPESPRITILTANGPVKAPLVALSDVAIGGIRVSNVQVIVQDLGNDMLLSGLLGMNFFKDMELTVKQNKLILKVSHAY